MVETTRKPSALNLRQAPIRQKLGGSPPLLQCGSLRRPVLCPASAYTHRTAVAYYRTSSATNVGCDKDSLPRQQEAVQAYAQSQGIEIVREFYDAAVSGADPVMSRDGFSDMLSYMLGNGARIVLVENASRFARDLAVQLVGHELLKGRGITLVPVDAPNHFEDDTPTATMVRSILGAVSQFEKEALVLKLRKSRDRKSAVAGQRIEGRKDWKALRNPVAITMAKEAAKRGLSLRDIAAELAQLRLVGRSGKPYGPQSIKRMLRQS